MNDLSQHPQTICVSKAAAAAGTTTTYSTTGTTLWCIAGKAYSKAAATNAATPTLDVNTGLAFAPVAANTGCVFVLGYDAAGTLRVAQGAAQGLDGTASGATAAFSGAAPQFPLVPDTVCPFAYLVTKVGASGAAWTFGVSNLAGPPANTLHTFVDLMTLPGRPQVA